MLGHVGQSEDLTVRAPERQLAAQVASPFNADELYCWFPTLVLSLNSTTRASQDSSFEVIDRPYAV